MKKWKATSAGLAAVLGLASGLRAQQTVVATPAAPTQTYMVYTQPMPQGYMCQNGQCMYTSGTEVEYPLLDRLRSWRPFGFLRKEQQPAMAYQQHPVMMPKQHTAMMPPQQPMQHPTMMPMQARTGSAEAMAYMMRKQDADAMTRRQAVRQLAMVDSKQWPEAEIALIAALRGDKYEVVRQEAAAVLGKPGCASHRSLEALVMTASGSDKDGCPREASPLVRNAASQSIKQILPQVRQQAMLPRPAQDKQLLADYYSTMEEKPIAQTIEDANQMLTQLALQPPATQQVVMTTAMMPGRAQPGVEAMPLKPAPAPTMALQPVPAQSMGFQQAPAQTMPRQTASHQQARTVPLQGQQVQAMTAQRTVEIVPAANQQPPVVIESLPGETCPPQQPVAQPMPQQQTMMQQQPVAAPSNRQVAVVMQTSEPATPVRQAAYTPPASQPTTMGQQTMARSRTPLRPSQQPQQAPVVSEPVEPPPPVPGSQAASRPNVEQLMIVLKHSVHPQQRQWAAENLSTPDCLANPEIVQTLLSAAGRDPSNEVRVGCIRALVKMNVKTVPVVTALKAISGDPNPEVEREAKLALNQLGDDTNPELPRLVNPEPQQGHIATPNGSVSPGTFIQRTNNVCR